MRTIPITTSEERVAVHTISQHASLVQTEPGTQHPRHYTVFCTSIETSELAPIRSLRRRERFMANDL